MNLSAKIFLAFFSFFACLLGLTLYITSNQTEKYEMSRMSGELSAAQILFAERLAEQERTTLKLVQTITLDQKFRSFLTQIKDNFYSFTEEIAKDTEADIVFMVDDAPKIRGIYPSSDENLALFGKNLNLLKIQDVIDLGREQVQIISLGKDMFSMIAVPLKESLSDDYALGAMVVLRRVSDEWVKNLLGSHLASSKVHVIFYNDGERVAGSVSREQSLTIIKNLSKIPVGPGSLAIDGNRIVTRREIFQEGDDSSGYVYCANLDLAMEPFFAMQKNIFFVGLGVFLIGLGGVAFFSQRIIRPLRQLLVGTREIVGGNYDFEIRHHSKDEVGQLSEAFNQMVKGLKEKQRMQETFGKYMHPTLVEEILSNPGKLALGGERKIQTILFCDVANFTSFSEEMPPETLIKLLNQYFGSMTEELLDREGVLDKYIGDGIMAFWGPPFAKGNFSLKACQAAIAMQKRLESMRDKWIVEGLPEIRVRIGLATGNMIVGNVGSEKALEYTCIGDTVNFGSRLEGINKVYGTEIIIDHLTYKEARHDILARELDTIQVKGRREGTPIFEVMAEESEATGKQMELRDRYESALVPYRAGNFESSAAEFQKISKTYSDTASQVLYQRSAYYLENPPKEWTGIHVMTEK